MPPEMVCRCAGPWHSTACWKSKRLQMHPVEPSPAWAAREAMLRHCDDVIAGMVVSLLLSPPKPAPLGGPGPFWAAVRALEKGGAT